MSPEQHSGQTRNVKITSKSFEIVTKCKYLGRTVSRHNCTHEKISRKSNLRDACYLSFQNLCTVLLPVVFIGVNIEHTPRVFEYWLENVFWTEKGNHRIPEKSA